jgi:cholestenol delta-isomerase
MLNAMKPNPTARNVKRAEEKCDGYNKPKSPQSRSGALSPTILPVLPSFDEPLQKELFAYFVFCTSDESCLYFGANFWARRVLPLSLSEPAIRYSLCSLSALQRSSMNIDMGSFRFTPKDLQLYALRQYNHAIRYTQTLLKKSSDGSEEMLIIGLVACILFISYENYKGDYHLAEMHLRSGLKIISKERTKARQSEIPKDIIQAFKRLELYIMSISESGDGPAEFPTQEFLDLTLPLGSGFKSVEDSIDVVLGIFRWIFLRTRHSEACPVAPEDLASVKKAFQKWNLEIERGLTVAKSGSKNQIQRPIALLRMYQLIMTIFLSAGVNDLQTQHDHHLHKYEEVVAIGERLLGKDLSTSDRLSTRYFCFDIGIISPLFWTAFKCRESRVRRRAVELLRSITHREGPWSGVNAASIAEFVINIEENGLGKDVCQHSILESARVHLVKTVANPERGEMRLTAFMRPNANHISWSTIEGCVHFR